MTTTTRPLSVEERTALAQLASPRAQLQSEVLSILVVFMFTFMLGVGMTRWLAGPPRGATLALLGGVAAVVALSLLVYVRRSVSPNLSAERAKHSDDLTRGLAEVTTHEVVDALRVEEFEDEGSAYYLKLADGRVLFLAGQYLYDYEAGEDEDAQSTPARFPCRRFKLERAAASGLLLELTPLGPAFPPSGTLPAFRTEDHHADRVPEDGQVLDVDFESLRARRAS